MSFVTIWRHKFAVMVAVLALWTVLAIGVWADSQPCAIYDDYGNCIPWTDYTPPADDAAGSD